MKRILICFVVLGLCLGLGSCGKAKNETIQIAVYEPLTGNSSSGGLETLAGVEMANRERPTVLGKTVEIIKADTKSDADAAKQVAQDLVQKHVTAAIGSCASYLSLAGSQTFFEGKVPVVSPGSTAPAVTANNPYYFRICFTDPGQGKVMAEYASNDLQAKTAAVVKNLDSAYSVSVCQAFKQGFVEKNGPMSVVIENNYVTDTADFTDVIAEIMDKQPDVVFAGGEYKECVDFIQSLRQKGYDKPILGGDTWDIHGFLEGVKDTSNIYLTAHYNSSNDESPKSQEFVKKCQNQGVEPASLTALGYDAYMLILDSIEKAGNADADPLRIALSQTQGFEGVAGNVTLDSNGDPVKPVVVDRITDGKLEYITMVTVANQD